MASLSLSVFCAKDHHFAHTRGAVDARMKTLTKESVGTDTKQAQPLSLQQEKKLRLQAVWPPRQRIASQLILKTVLYCFIHTKCSYILSANV